MSLKPSELWSGKILGGKCRQEEDRQNSSVRILQDCFSSRVGALIGKLQSYAVVFRFLACDNVSIPHFRKRHDQRGRNSRVWGMIQGQRREL